MSTTSKSYGLFRLASAFLVLVAVVVAVSRGAQDNHATRLERKQAFMRSCEDDKQKLYQCEMNWAEVNR